jgi:hypothetical protein
MVVRYSGSCTAVLIFSNTIFKNAILPFPPFHPLITSIVLLCCYLLCYCYIDPLYFRGEFTKEATESVYSTCPFVFWSYPPSCQLNEHSLKNSRSTLYELSTVGQLLINCGSTVGQLLIDNALRHAWPREGGRSRSWWRSSRA